MINKHISLKYNQIWARGQFTRDSMSRQIKVKIAEKYCKMFMGQRGRKMIHFCASETFILTQNSNCTFSHWTVHGDKSFTVYEEKHILRCHFTVFSYPPSPYQRYHPGCQDGADDLKCLWSSHGTVRLKRGADNGAGCVAETCGCMVASLPASNAAC